MLCRTPDEAFQAGWDDGERLGERLTPAQMDRFAELLRPYADQLLPAAEPAEDDPAA